MCPENWMLKANGWEVFSHPFAFIYQTAILYLSAIDVVDQPNYIHSSIV